jgi:hypothetical protein
MNLEFIQALLQTLSAAGVDPHWPVVAALLAYAIYLLGRKRGD